MPQIGPFQFGEDTTPQGPQTLTLNDVVSNLPDGATIYAVNGKRALPTADKPLAPRDAIEIVLADGSHYQTLVSSDASDIETPTLLRKGPVTPADKNPDVRNFGTSTNPDWRQYNTDTKTWDPMQGVGSPAQPKQRFSDPEMHNFGTPTRPNMQLGVKDMQTGQWLLQKDVPGAADGGAGTPGGAMNQAQVIAYVRQNAAKYGLDPDAALAVADQEGLGGGIGDGGTSFGPWQLHIGGALPGNITSNQQDWAWSQEGIDYALRTMAQSANGLTGQDAVAAIVNGFERPADPGSEINRAAQSLSRIQQDPDGSQGLWNVGKGVQGLNGTGGYGGGYGAGPGNPASPKFTSTLHGVVDPKDGLEHWYQMDPRTGQWKESNIPPSAPQGSAGRSGSVQIQSAMQQHYQTIQYIKNELASGHITPEEADQYQQANNQNLQAAMIGASPFEVAKQNEAFANELAGHGASLIQSNLSSGASLAKTMMDAGMSLAEKGGGSSFNPFAAANAMQILNGGGFGLTQTAQALMSPALRMAQGQGGLPDIMSMVENTARIGQQAQGAQPPSGTPVGAGVGGGAAVGLPPAFQQPDNFQAPDNTQAA